MNTELIDQIRTLIAPSLTQCGVELIEAQWTAGRRHGVLRVVIDRRDGITLDDCERASTAISAVLDAYDPIANAYSLEVSSPGAERPLQTEEEFVGALGRRVNIRYRNGEGETVVEGRLVAAGAETLELEVRVGRNRQTTAFVPVEAILSARIVVDI